MTGMEPGNATTVQTRKTKASGLPGFPALPGAACTAALAVHHPLTKCFLIASICCTHSMVPMNLPFRSRTAM